MFERFTDAARTAVARAEAHARRLEDGHIGCEHQMLGVLEDPAVAAALERTTTPAAVVRDDLLAEVSRAADPATGWSSSLPFTATAKQALELTLRESLRTGGSISPEHLLVGIALAAAEPTAAVLSRLGLTPDLLRGHLGLAGRPLAGGPGEGDRP